MNVYRSSETNVNIVYAFTNMFRLFSRNEVINIIVKIS